MNFLENILQRLVRTRDRPVIQEAREGRLIPTTGGELLASIRVARAFLGKGGLRKGDRCALLAHNSVRWAALDLALMAEGIVVVPLYARQAPAELVGMMKDCSPSLVCCGDPALRDSISRTWPDGPPLVLFDEIFSAAGQTSAEALAGSRPAPCAGAGHDRVADTPAALADADPVKIIYTSGTLGEPKGVVLNVGNLNHMLPCTTMRLDLLMGPREEPELVFHYLPFCFAGSWILLLTCLSRNSLLTLSTDLNKLAEEMRIAAPHYFLNVPALLERVRAGVEEQLNKKGGPVKTIYQRARAAWFRRQHPGWRLLPRLHGGPAAGMDALCLLLARALLFPAVKKKIGPNLKALICGSAPLARETQLFFMMLGLPVLQVYGLTETTAICTMDHPRAVVPGRVGPAIPGIEMKLGEDGEIMVRGPNIFPGYWNRPQETAQTRRDGWFLTGDQGEVDQAGNWSITGRVKNLLVLSSGHNVAPEPIEEVLLKAVPGAQHVVLLGHGRSSLAAILTGKVTAAQVEAALAVVNPQLPHYKRIHAFHIGEEPFTIENGLLTANGKLRRSAIAARLQEQIEDLYRKKVKT